MRGRRILACMPLLFIVLLASASSAAGHGGHAHPVYGPPAPDWAWGEAPEQQRAAAADRDARGQRSFEAALAAAPVERGGRCVDTAEFEGVGDGCRTQDGLLRLELPGGGESITHGPDYLEAAADADPTTLPARTVSAIRHASKDDISCVPASQRHTRLVYAVPADGNDRSPAMVEELRRSAYELSAVMDNEARSLDPTAGRRLAMACDATGEAIVDVYRLRTPGASADFTTVQADLHAQAGSSPSMGTVRWLVYYDHHLGTYGGIAQFYRDTTASIANNNNQGGRVALQDNSNGRTAPDWWILLHEAAHNMGAVQDGAPDANGRGHCDDGLDVMCYEEGLGTYVSTACQLSEFDCDHDSYFHPSPAAGSWLAGNWNLAATTNGYMQAYDAPVDTTPPSAPTGVRSAGHGGWIELDWTASADAGSGVAGYRVYRESSTGVWSIVDDAWPGDTWLDATWSGLSAGTSHAMRITAYDRRGNESPPATLTASSGSNDGIIRSVGGTLPTPEDFHVTSSTSTSLALAWQPVIGASGTYYRLRRRAEGGAWVSWFTTSNLSYDLTGLAAGTRYDIEIQAIKDGRLSALATVSAWTAGGADLSAPAVPGNVRVAASSGTTPTVAWEAPLDAVSYVISVEASPGVWSQVATTPRLQHMVTGQAYATTRTIGVAARDAAGNVSPRATVTFSAPPAPDTTRPSTSTPSLSSRTTTSLTLSWTAATDTVGVTGYRLFVANSTTKQWLLVAATEAGVRSATATNLQPGTAHWVFVQAVDAAGNGTEFSSYNIWSTLTDSTAPTMPTGLVASDQTSSSVQLTWNASTDNSGVASYRVYRQNGDLSWTQIATTTSTTYTVADLSPLTSYTFGVSAVDIVDLESGKAAVATSTLADAPDTQAPSQPGGVTAGTVTGTSAALSWSASTDDRGVAGYRVYRQSPDASAAPIATPTGTSVTISGLTPATTYTIAVAAIDAAGNESTSATVSFTTPDTLAPSAPGSLAASSTTSSGTTLTWTASSDNVGVTGYRVSRTSPGTAVLTTTTGLSYDVTGLAAATTYTFAVTATDAAGNEATSSISVTTPDDVAPSEPGTVAVGTVTDTTAALSWAASTDNAGVTGYRVYRQSPGASAAPVATPTGTNVTISGLTPATDYTLAVTAVDAAGNESTSAPVSFTTPDTVAPSAPGSLAANSTTSTGTTLTWTASTDEVGVTGYRVSRTSPGSALLTTTTSLSYAVTGLAAATSYTFAVTAIDAAGNEATSSVSVTTVDDIAPSQPGAISVGTVTDTTVALSWAAATDNAAVTGYRVYRQSPDASGAPIATPAGTSVTIGSLTSGVSYTFAIAAIDAAGNEGPARAITVATADVVPPTQPGGFAGTATSDTSIHLAWNASSDNVGVAGYRVLRVVAGVPSAMTTTSALQYDVTGLDPATAYRFQVEAYDAAGRTSTRSTVDVATPDTTAPTQPGAPSVTSTSDTAIAFGWGASTDAVGVTGYRLYRTAPTASGTPIGTTGGATSYVAGSLAPDTVYTFEITSIDAAGNESTAATVSARTAAEPDTTAPSSPTNVAATSIMHTTAALGWAAASDAGGVAGYRVERLVGSTWTAVASPSVTSFAITGLSPGTSSSWRVLAIDAGGNLSAPSATLTFTTLSDADLDAPSAPTGPIQATASANGTVGLAWGASTDAVGVTGYRIYQLGPNGWTHVASSDSTSVALSALGTGQTITFAVAAIDAALNESTRTVVDVFVPSPLRAAPDAPVSLAAARTISRITLSWGVAGGEQPASWTITALRFGNVIGSRTVSSTTSTFGPYAPGTAVSFRVVANGPSGVSPAATIDASTLRDTIRPTRPGAVRLLPRGRGRLFVSWGPSRDNVGVLRYEVRLLSRGLRGRVVRVGAPRRAVTVLRLKPRRYYDVTVRAIDRSGNASPWTPRKRVRVR